MYQLISNTMLVKVAVAMAAFGHSLETKGQRQAIAAFANDPAHGFARTDGKLWGFPTDARRRGIFKPAFLAADKPVVTPAGKPAGKPAGNKPALSKPWADMNGKERAAHARACKVAKSGKAVPVVAPAAAPVAASGKLTNAQRDKVIAMLEALLAS